MKLSVRAMMLPFAACLAVVAVAGCVSQKTIDTYESRLKALEEKGTPDSLLSSVRVYLSQAKAGKRSGNGTLARASIDSAKGYVNAAEQWIEAKTQAARAHVDPLLAGIREKAGKLTGMQRKEADSLLAIIDSYITKGWYIQAKDPTDFLNELMPSLFKDEESAGKAASQIAGTWSMTKKHTENGGNAVEKSRVTFRGDGTFEMNEQMKGQTSRTLKEDWEFQSQGTYAIKGDTILLSVQKEKRLREIFWNLKDGQAWVKTERKPYDTVIANGSKDRFFTFEYLKENFKK